MSKEAERAGKNLKFPQELQAHAGSDQLLRRARWKHLLQELLKDGHLDHGCQPDSQVYGGNNHYQVLKSLQLFNHGTSESSICKPIPEAATRVRGAAEWCLRRRGRRRRRRGGRSTPGASAARPVQRGSIRGPSARDQERIQGRTAEVDIFAMEQARKETVK